MFSLILQPFQFLPFFTPFRSHLIHQAFSLQLSPDPHGCYLLSQAFRPYRPSLSDLFCDQLGLEASAFLINIPVLQYSSVWPQPLRKNHIESTCGPHVFTCGPHVLFQFHTFTYTCEEDFSHVRHMWGPANTCGYRVSHMLPTWAHMWRNVRLMWAPIS